MSGAQGKVGTDGIPRDSKGRRMRRCPGCRRWRRSEHFPQPYPHSPRAKHCGECLRADVPPTPGAARERAEIEQAREAGSLGGAIDEIRRRVAAARAMKAVVCGRCLSEAEIDAACDGA